MYMYISTYIYVYTYVFIHICVHMYIDIYVWLWCDVRIHTSYFVEVHTDTDQNSAFVHVDIIWHMYHRIHDTQHTSTHVHTHTHAHTLTRSHTHTHTHTYTHSHTHTHTQTHATMQTYTHTLDIHTHTFTHIFMQTYTHISYINTRPNIPSKGWRARRVVIWRYQPYFRDTLDVKQYLLCGYKCMNNIREPNHIFVSVFICIQTHTCKLRFTCMTRSM